ncbi:MAG: hypothetical protein ACKVP4_03430 [Hyphomicrobium sp.]
MYESAKLQKAKAASWLSGSGLFAGCVGLLSIFVSLSPALESLHHFKEAAELYAIYIRDPISKAFHLNTRTASVAFDVLVVWISTFVAVNAFVYRSDGTFLWRHIGQNYCYKDRQSFVSQFACRLPKYLWAFLMTPIVCLASVFATARTGNTHLQMAYVIVEPKTVATYLVTLFAIPTVLLGLTAAVLRLV